MDVFLLLLLFTISTSIAADTSLYVIELRCQIDDAVERFERSLKIFGYTHDVADLSAYGGVPSEVPFARKVEVLRKHLSHISSKYVLVIDSHNSILLNGPTDIINQVDKMGFDFIFADTDTNAGEKLPPGNAVFKGLLARASKLKELLDSLPDDISEDKFIGALQFGISKNSITSTTDKESALFQLVEKDSDAYLKVRYDGDRGFVVNEKTDTVPTILMASPNGKVKLNSLSNYLVRVRSPETGFQVCKEEKLELSHLSQYDYPMVQLSVMITQPTPFLDVFFERLANLSYPKHRIDLVIYCTVEKQGSVANAFVAKHPTEYHSGRVIRLGSSVRPIEAFRKALSNCLTSNECKYLFYLEPTTHLKKTDTIEHLMMAKKNAIAPMMTCRSTSCSSFWDALREDDFHEPSKEYFDIVERREIGIWNVPLVGSSVLFSRWAVGQLLDAIEDDGILLYDIANAALQRNVFLFVDNREDFGHLVVFGNYNLNHLHNDLWQIFDNPKDWEERYIHPEYFRFANDSTTKDDFEQPCSDVFWVPLMSETFCKQLIEEMENFGEWSGGSNLDPRLEGGYENVPTIDIHMRQVDWEKHWMHVLEKYVYPIQLKLWEGYNDKPTARMNFVVRYRQGEQPSLRLHHDASSYTLDMALNRAHIDYTGGGVRYPRYNCTLVDTRVGWPLVFPGRLTHLHEGLETTSGTRYIFVTFINP